MFLCILQETNAFAKQPKDYIYNCFSLKSMTGSSHHELSKWLESLLEPVLKRFSTHCIRDSFTFADVIQNSKDAQSFHVLLRHLKPFYKRPT